MYHWECLEKIAREDHRCDSTCLVDDDEGSSKAATAIELQVNPLYERLFHLADGLHYSHSVFEVPVKRFKNLESLLKQIVQAVNEQETKAASSTQDGFAREQELKLSSEATDAVTIAANAAADAAGAA